MGFGYLLFGYLFFCDFTLRTHTGLSFDVLPDPVAWLFLALGCAKLCAWSKPLKAGAALCFVMLPVSLVGFGIGLGVFDGAWTGVFSQSVFPLADALTRMVFHYLLLFGVIRIAALCEGQEEFIKGLKARVLLVSICFVLLFAVRIALMTFGTGILAYAAMAASVLNMCYLIPVEVSLYQAYRRITLA